MYFWLSPRLSKFASFSPHRNAVSRALSTGFVLTVHLAPDQAWATLGVRAQLVQHAKKRSVLASRFTM
jgi:hypothetical protein